MAIFKVIIIIFIPQLNVLRRLFSILALISFISTRAQTHIPTGSMGFSQWIPLSGYHPLGDSSNPNQKWIFSKYAAISAGYIFYNGGGGSVISAPVGLQVTRELNNNLYAFAGVSVAPTFFSYSSFYNNPTANKSYPAGYQPNTYNFGMNSRVEMGLMYMNDAKTFSISGSIGIERSSNPYYPVYPSNSTNKRK